MARINQLSKDIPTQFEINNLLKNNILSTLNCHNVGRIIEFNAETQLCTVEMLQIKQFNVKSFTPVPITNVPLIILGGGSGNITMPNPVGTICLLIFMDRNIDAFLETGETYTPDSTRMHDFTDCIALCTFKTLVNPITNYDENAVSILNSAIINEVQNNASLKVYPNLIELLTSGKVRVANNTQNLAILMQKFLTACEGITVDTQTGIISTTSRDNFSNLGVSFNELLAANGYTPPEPTEMPTEEPTETPVDPSEAQQAIEQSYATSRPIGQPIFRLSDYLANDEIRLEGATVLRSTYYLLYTAYGTTYGEGDGSTTFQLPDFRNKVIWGAQDFGYLEAGLPNITGGIRWAKNGQTYQIGSESLLEGAFTSSPTGNTAIVERTDNAYGAKHLEFDASKSNPIYGKSDTVQPPAIKVRVITRYK